MALLADGYETTAHQVTNVVYTLLTHDKQLRQLKGPPGAAAGLGRGNAAVHGVRQRPRPRIATADVKLGEVVARAGEPVLYSRSSANRDERVFPRAGELDITRDPNPTRRLRLRAPPLPGRRAGADGAPGGARHHLVPAPYRSTRERADLASRDHDTRPGRVSGHLLKAPPATARAAVPQQPASDSACVALPVSPPAYSARAMV